VRHRWALLAVVVLVASACNSTTGTKPADRTVDDAADSVAPSDGGSTAGATAEPGSTDAQRAASGAAARTKGAAAADGSRARAGTSTSGPRLVPGVPGVDATTIKLGARFVTGDQAFTKTIGAEGVSAGDHKGMYKAVFDEINAHGGIAGRKIVPAYYPYDVTRIAEAKAQQEAACRSWTEDAKVFAAVSSAPTGSTIGYCMARKKTPLIQDTVEFYFDQQTMKDLAPYFVMPGSPNGTRIGRFWMDALFAQKFFGTGAKVGIVRFDDPAHERIVNGVLKPKLKARGIPVAAESVLTKPEDLSAGVLRFRASGVTHVLVVDDAGLASMVWMAQAESQGFRPKYGMTSVNAPSALLHQNVPHSQLRGSMGVGWVPMSDVLPAQDPPQTAEDARCLAIMKRKGVDTTARTEKLLALWTCNVTFFLERAVERSSTFSAQGLRASIDGLSRSFKPTGTFAARFGAGRLDGTSAVRNFVFNDGCDCFRYTSAVYAVD
jgi:hypothetical protein